MSYFNTNNHIIPRDFEVEINPNSNFYIKFNSAGHIEYVNQDFCNISGYNDYEIIDASIDILVHPDMPKIFYEILNEHLAKKEKHRLISKFIAKDGRYFWLISNFETKTNDYGEIIGHYNHCKFVPKQIVHHLSPLYNILNKIEVKTGNTKVAKRYLIGYLEELRITHDKFIENLCENANEYKINDPYQEPNSKGVFQNNYSNYNNPNTFYKKPTEQLPEESPIKKRSLFQRIFGLKE